MPAVPAPASASGSAPASATRGGTPLRSLILHTHDVARSLKPSADGELAHALHETLHFALDGRQEDWGIWNDIDPSERCGPSGSTAAAGADAPESAQQQAPASADGQQGQAWVNGTANASTSAGPSQASVSADASEDDDSLPPARSGFFLSGNPERPYISYGWSERSRALTLPNPVVVANPTTSDPCSPENRSEFDVTAKFFFLEDGAHSLGAGASSSASASAARSAPGSEAERFPVAYIEDALQRLTMSTSLITIDTFIVSFPTLRLDADSKLSPCGGSDAAAANGADAAAQSAASALPTGGCGAEPGTDLSHSADLQPATDAAAAAAAPSGASQRLQHDIRAVRKVWEAISPNPQLVSLGVADFSLPALQALCESSEAGGAASEASVPSALRKPRLVTVNVKGNPCAIDKGLNAYCEKNGMMLVAHNDQRDILPARTLPALLQEFKDDLPHPVPEGARLRPLWVLKYSTVIRERGILADKGYIVYAACDE